MHQLAMSTTGTPAAPKPNSTQTHPSWRLELFYKSREELRSQLPFLQRHGITRINLTNKSEDDDLLSSVRILQAAFPGLDVCVHYSIKYN